MMGAILKFFLILFCIYFIISRLGGYILKGLLWFLGAQVVKKQSQHYDFNSQNNSQSQKKKPEGEIKVDFVPENTRNKEANFKGGDYVDFEEVK